MKNKLTIVKVGGGILNDMKLFDEFLKSFSKIKGLKLLVHGGGIIASNYMIKLGIPVKIIDGRRITDQNSLDIAVMTYAGLINKKIVATLQKFKCNSIGLSGADGNIITSKIREKKDIDYGLVGDIIRINSNFLKHLSIISFKPDALQKFSSLAPSPLELSESIELLRALENGMVIGTILLEGDSFSVDVKEDYARAKEMMMTDEIRKLY